MDDPRGPAVTVGPFNQQFAYRPESGDLLLFPSWASLSIASASNSRCPKVAIVSILLRGPPPDGPSSKDRRVLSTLELIDNSVAVATLESAPEDPLFVGSPERGIGPLDLHAVLAPIGGHLATKGGDVPGAVVLDIFGSPVLRIGFEELLASLSEPGALRDVAAFNEELARLADRGLALPEVRKLPRHARAEAFFEWQRRQWGEGRPWDALQGSRAFGLLRRLFARAAEHFLALFAAVDSVDAEDERMFIWAASLGAGQGHEEHDHPGSAVSGVYYARSPDGAGRLLLKDPRGPYPPFQVGVWGMPPKAGDFLLFPGWLRHKVESSIFPEKTTPRRVAYSMNLAGKWEVSAHTYHQLELAL